MALSGAMAHTMARVRRGVVDTKVRAASDADAAGVCALLWRASLCPFALLSCSRDPSMSHRAVPAEPQPTQRARRGRINPERARAAHAIPGGTFKVAARDEGCQTDRTILPFSFLLVACLRLVAIRHTVRVAGVSMTSLSENFLWQFLRDRTPPHTTQHNTKLTSHDPQSVPFYRLIIVAGKSSRPPPPRGSSKVFPGHHRFSHEYCPISCAIL